MGKSSKRIVGLDFIRALSAILIILYHYTARYLQSFESNIEFPFSVSWGAFAVSTFFILSGFLSYKHFSRDDKWYHYLLGRAKRLYVGYLPCMLITTIVVGLLLPSRSQPLHVVLLNLTMLQGLFGVGSVDGAYWTLFVEIVFYITVAALILIKQHKKIYKLQLVWLFGLFVCTGLVKLGFASGLIKTFLMMYLNLEYGHLFLIGIALSDLVNNGWKRPFSIATLLLSIGYDTLYHSALYTIIVVASVIHIFVATMPKVREYKFGPLGGVFQYISGISYPLYLLHQFIGYAILQKLEGAGITSELVILVPMLIAICLASFVHYAIEAPDSSIFARKKKA